jgi:hypothetical protein
MWLTGDLAEYERVLLPVGQLADCLPELAALVRPYRSRERISAFIDVLVGINECERLSHQPVRLQLGDSDSRNRTRLRGD